MEFWYVAHCITLIPFTLKEFRKLSLLNIGIAWYLLKYPLFRTKRFFTLQAQSLFKLAAVSLSFLPCNVSHSKQAAIMFSFPLYFSANISLTSSVKAESFSTRFFIPLLSIKPLFPISIDSLLYWEGHHWDSCLSHSYRHHSQFPTSALRLPMHFTQK